MYTSDIPTVTTDSLNLLYADDITQIITYSGKSKKMMAKKVEREIKLVNDYEKKWKIKTNTGKFKIIPLAVKKKEPITIDGNILPYSSEGTILGLHMNTRGILPQIKHNKSKASAALTTMKRFDTLPTHMKLHLVKACVLPILTYPSYPLNSIAKTPMFSLQKIQNKALRFAYGQRHPYTMNTKELHQTAKLKTINEIVYKRGELIRNKLTDIKKDEIYTQILQQNDNSEHGWFRKPIVSLNKPKPNAIYTHNDL